MGIYNTLAEAFRYPAPGRSEALQAGLQNMPTGPVRNALAAFYQDIRPLGLGQWEELHTRTLDLNPLTAPYVGYQIWGEGYKRGEFMAELSRAMRTSGVEQDGELPDHLVPVLRYLEGAPQPLPSLVEALAPAVQKMCAALKKNEPDNPYLHLFEAVLQVLQTVKE